MFYKYFVQVLSLLTFISIFLINGDESNIEKVLFLSNTISEKINLFASRYVNASQLEKKFKAKKEFYKKSDTEELQILKENLENFFQLKKQELRNLSRQIRIEFDNFISVAFTSNHSVFESRSLYYENLYNHFPYFGAINVQIQNDSSLKIPRSLNVKKPMTKFTITWTERIIDYLKNYKTTDIRRTHFANIDGLLRSYPSIKWKRNKYGFESDYDARLQSWFIGIKETPSTVIIIIDTSAAMSGESLIRAKEIATILLGSLSQHQRVAVISSASRVWKKYGDYLFANATVLGCDKSRLVRATDRNVRLLQQEVAHLSAYAGSDHTEGFRLAFHLLRQHQSRNEKYLECRSNILFITGTSENLQLRCSAGFYQYSDNNKKNFHPGDICLYNVDTLLNVIAILQNSLPGIKSNIFTFLTSTEYQVDDILPGKIACENNGAMSRIYFNENYYNQMYPYFNYIKAREYSFEPIITQTLNSPIDGANIITLSHTVVSQVTKRLIGVVAFDIDLAEIENIMGKSQAGYVFMLNLYDGSTMIHPLLAKSYEHPYSKLGVPISDLEMEEGKLPNSFYEVIKQMKGRNSGNITIDQDARQVFLFQNDSLLWKPVRLTTYHFAEISGTFFGIAIKNHDQSNVTKERELISRTRVIYRPVLNDISLLNEKSAVYVSPKGFCNLKDFMVQFESNFSTLLDSINKEECIIMPAVIQDASLTVFMETYWKGLNFSLIDIAMVYVATETGMIRVFPSISLSDSDIHEPWRYSWYTEAILNPKRISCTQSNSRFTRLHDTVTFSTSISACQSQDSDCFDAYGVLGVDVKRSSLNNQIRDINSSLCCINQQMHNVTCSSKCYLFTENGEHVLTFGEPSRKSNLKLMFPYIEKLLRKFKILSRRRVKTFQSQCLKNSTRTVLNLDNYNCVVESKSSYLDRPRLVRIGNIFGRSLMNDPCNNGFFYVTRINTTNMILLVILDRIKLETRKCNLYKNLLTEEQKGIEYVPCPLHSFYHKSRQNTTGCPRRRFISMPCLYNNAITKIFNLFNIYFISLLNLIGFYKIVC